MAEETTTGQTTPLQPTTYDFHSKEFFLKIAQLLIGITCAGLYSEGVKVMTESIMSQTFPNVVFSCLIIITSVIVMGYMLGHVMPDILVRIFNAIGLVLYFVSATVTMHTWVHKRRVKPELQVPMKLLFVQAVNSYVNSFLYGLDMYFSVKNSIAFK